MVVDVLCLSNVCTKKKFLGNAALGAQPEGSVGDSLASRSLWQRRGHPHWRLGLLLYHLVSSDTLSFVVEIGFDDVNRVIDRRKDTRRYYGTL
jgi:hypothetical protein